MHFLAIIAIFVTVVIETAEQLSFKASAKLEHYHKQFLVLGVVLHGFQLLAWFLALTLLPLSIAAPMLGATYITVSLGSWLLYGEKINKRHWIGIISIVLGLALISRTET
jgi:drug/metabolite transporter (DMT)-like permease